MLKAKGELVEEGSEVAWLFPEQEDKVGKRRERKER